MIEVYDSLAAECDRVEAICNELSELVCKLGPDMLTRGMKYAEANEAILNCLKSVVSDRDLLVASVRKHCIPPLADMVLQKEVPDVR